jgi:hypothetical protein
VRVADGPLMITLSCISVYPPHRVTQGGGHGSAVVPQSQHSSATTNVSNSDHCMQSSTHLPYRPSMCTTVEFSYPPRGCQCRKQGTPRNVEVHIQVATKNIIHCNNETTSNLCRALDRCNNCRHTHSSGSLQGTSCAITAGMQTPTHCRAPQVQQLQAQSTPSRAR